MTPEKVRTKILPLINQALEDLTGVLPIPGTNISLDVDFASNIVCKE
jgi:hypothetical protein